MPKGVIVVLSVGVCLTVISFSCTSSAEYVNHQRTRNGEESSASLMEEDELFDSYLPDPPVIGLRPPGSSNDLVPRIDRPPIRRRHRPQPGRSRSRYRNNFGKGKRMKRPPGPFKVVGKQKTCSYRRKMVQQPRSPYRSRSDQNRNIVYKDQQNRHGRSQGKRNLLDGGGGVNGQPMNYYRNLPHQKNGYYTKSSYAPTPQYPKQQPQQLNPRKSMTPFYSSIKSIDHGLDLNNYRVFIHQYYDSSDEPDPRPPLNPHHLHPVPATTTTKNTGTRMPDLRGNNAMGNSNLLNHKTKLLTKVLPAFNAPPPRNTKSPVAMGRWQAHQQPQPVHVLKEWTRNQPIMQSHRPNFDNDGGGEQNKFYTSSSVIQVKEDDDARTMRRYKGVLIRQGEPTTAIKEISPPSPLNHSHGNVAGKPTKQRVEESSPNEVIIGVPWARSATSTTSTTTEDPQRVQTERPSIGVIYVTPEPYTGEWTVTGDDLRAAVTEAEIIVGHIVPQAAAAASAATNPRTRIMNSGGHFYNNNNNGGGGADWRPIYPTTSDIDRWFETAAVTITPKNKHHWVSLVAAAGKK